jgi:pimeloyl-CoA synthetase
MNKLLANALKNTFRMKKEDAESLAKTVETIFQGRKEIEDMTIDKYQRALLYELQKEKLLNIRREEMKEEGKKLRKYYWSFNHHRIQEEAHKKPKKEMYRIYEEIPRSAWNKRSLNT